MRDEPHWCASLCARAHRGEEETEGGAERERSESGERQSEGWRDGGDPKMNLL